MEKQIRVLTAGNFPSLFRSCAGNRPLLAFTSWLMKRMQANLWLTPAYSYSISIVSTYHNIFLKCFFPHWVSSSVISFHWSLNFVLRALKCLLIGSFRWLALTILFLRKRLYGPHFLLLTQHGCECMCTYERV